MHSFTWIWHQARCSQIYIYIYVYTHTHIYTLNMCLAFCSLTNYVSVYEVWNYLHTYINNCICADQQKPWGHATRPQRAFNYYSITIILLSRIVWMFGVGGGNSACRFCVLGADDDREFCDSLQAFAPIAKHVVNIICHSFLLRILYVSQGSSFPVSRWKPRPRSKVCAWCKWLFLNGVSWGQLYISSETD